MQTGDCARICKFHSRKSAGNLVTESLDLGRPPPEGTSQNTSLSTIAHRCRDQHFVRILARLRTRCPGGARACVVQSNGFGSFVFALTRFLLPVCCFLIAWLSASAQAQTSADSLAWHLQLDSVMVSGDGYAPGEKPLFFTEPDVLLSGTVQLQYLGGVALRQNGSAGVSTLNIRGVSSVRTALNWEGIQINDPQTGSPDASVLIPYLTPLAVNNLPKGTQAAELQSKSFNPNQARGLDLQWGLGNTHSLGIRYEGFRLYLSSDQYDLPHYDPIGDRRIEDGLGAKLRQGGIAWQSAEQRFLRGWTSKRQAYGMLAQRRFPRRSDEIAANPNFRQIELRYLETFTREGTGYNNAPATVLQFAILGHGLNYEDAQRDIRNSASSIQALLRGKHQFNQRLSLSSEQRHIRAENQFYTEDATVWQQETQLHCRWGDSSKQWGLWEASAGVGSQTGVGVQPIGSIKWTNQEKRVSILARRLLRWPVLDDRFWQQGGREDVREESGWALESSLKASSWLQLDFFGRSIRHYIIWLPAQPFWQASDAGTVRELGAEISVFDSWRMGEVQVLAKAQSTFIARQLQDERLNGVLPMSPNWLSTAHLDLSWNSWTLNALAQGIGAQYTDLSGLNETEAYALIQTGLSYSFKQLSLQVLVDNLLNTDIPSPEFFPTAGRRVFCRLQLDL